MLAANGRFLLETGRVLELYFCWRYAMLEENGKEWIFLPDAATLKLMSQILGFIGTTIIVIGMQQKKYKNIVICKIGNEFFASLHYLLLGGYTGMLANLASCFTNSVYYFRIKKGKSTLPFQIIFATMFVAIGALSWHGYISIFVVMAKLISSVALGIKNPRTIRILNLISNPCWLIYNIYMGSIIGMISDSLVIISVVIAIIRLDILHRPDPKAEEIQTAQ